jgi:hypothetical protein
MAEQTWYWQSLTEETQIPGFYRVEIRISSDEDTDENAATLAVLNGFLAPEQPLAGGQP